MASIEDRRANTGLVLLGWHLRFAFICWQSLFCCYGLCFNLQAYGAVLLARVLAASSNAANVAREMICNSRALDALLRMLASSDLSVQLAAVRALAKISWLVRCYA